MTERKRDAKGRFIAEAATITKAKLTERSGSVAGSGTRREVTLIEEGWGSSGYYSRQLLERDGPKAWPIGTHMFLDHPTQADEFDRPERSVKDIVGEIAVTPRMEGGKLVSEARIFDHWKPVVDELAHTIGVSIRAAGELEEDGHAEGRDGPVVQELFPDEFNSVDLVTRAGRGGKLGNLIESARGHEPLDEAAVSEELMLVEASYEELRERDVPTDERIALAKKGQAIPVRDGSGNIINGRFPMANCGDVSNAAQSIGRGNAPNQELKTFIGRVASKMGCPTPFKESRPSDGGEELTMGEKEQLSELQETVRQHETKLSEAQQLADAEKTRADRAEDALEQQTARNIVNEALAYDGEDEDRKIPDLPDRAIERVRESALRSLPKDEDGKLDNDRLAERVRKLAKDEDAYLKEGRSSGSAVTGMGDSATGGTTTEESAGNGGASVSDQNKKALVESFIRQGMSKEAAEIAAEGR